MNRNFRLCLHVLVLKSPVLSVPHVRIQGAPDLHVDQGSVINLTCIISYSPEPPVYVFWYRGDTVSRCLKSANSEIKAFITCRSLPMTLKTDGSKS